MGDFTLVHFLIKKIQQKEFQESSTVQEIKINIPKVPNMTTFNNSSFLPIEEAPSEQSQNIIDDTQKTNSPSQH